MAEEGTERFSHRVKVDGSVDSICLACLTTISSRPEGVNLEREEEDHVCRFAIPERRYGRLPAGMERGRRRSDAQWEKLAQEKAVQDTLAQAALAQEKAG